MATSSIIEIQNAEGYTLIRFNGFLDASTVAQARPVLQEKVPADCSQFVIDIAKVDFLDSHGVGMFVSLLKRAHLNHGRMIIAGADGQPASVLHMVGLNGSLVSYCTTVEEAQQFLALGLSQAKG